MKKLFLGLLMATFTLSIYSCRETTDENVENAAQEAEADAENMVEDAGNEANDAMEEVAEETEGVDGDI